MYMKYLLTILGALLLCAGGLQAQFHGMEPRPPSVSEKVGSSPDQNLLFGFLNTQNFSMSHSISMSYLSMGSSNVGVTMYTNTMRYQIAEPLSLRADVGFMFSPFGSSAGLLKNDVNKIFLERAQLDYRPTKDFSVSVQFRQIPVGAMYPYTGLAMDPRYSYSPFGSDLP